ncbi:MAG: hypothetical protein AB7P04_10225 [Bacteriovoracia bacterium]
MDLGRVSYVTAITSFLLSASAVAGGPLGPVGQVNLQVHQPGLYRDLMVPNPNPIRNEDYRRWTPMGGQYGWRSTLQPKTIQDFRQRTYEFRPHYPGEWTHGMDGRRSQGGNSYYMFPNKWGIYPQRDELQPLPTIQDRLNYDRQFWNSNQLKHQTDTTYVAPTRSPFGPTPPPPGPPSGANRVTSTSVAPARVNTAVTPQRVDTRVDSRLPSNRVSSQPVITQRSGTTAVGGGAPSPKSKAAAELEARIYKDIPELRANLSPLAKEILILQFEVRQIMQDLRPKYLGERLTDEQIVAKLKERVARAGELYEGLHDDYKISREEAETTHDLSLGGLEKLVRDCEAKLGVGKP